MRPRPCRLANLLDSLAGNGHEKRGRAAAGKGASAAGDPGASQADWEARQRQCMPCRGTGSLLSRLGGEEHVVDCPWCAGSGERTQGIDAQARWLAEREQEGEPQQAGAQAAGA